MAGFVEASYPGLSAVKAEYAAKKRVLPWDKEGPGELKWSAVDPQGEVRAFTEWAKRTGFDTSNQDDVWRTIQPIVTVVGLAAGAYFLSGPAAASSELSAAEAAAAASDAGTLYAPSAAIAGGDAGATLGLTSAEAGALASDAGTLYAPAAASGAGKGLTLAAIGEAAKTGLEVVAAVATTKIAYDSLTGKSRALGTGEQAPPGWQVIDVPAGEVAPDPPAAQGLFGQEPAQNSALLLLLAGAVVIFLVR